MSDDEFVARAGELWVWIDRVWETAAGAAIALLAVLLVLGVPWFVALFLVAGTVLGLSWAVIERERDRRFPGEATS